MWKDLTMSQKAEVMKMASANGIYDLNSIRSLYDSANTYATGGDTEAPVGANIGNILNKDTNTKGRKVYVSKRGARFNTREEAIRDNATYGVKYRNQDGVKTYVEGIGNIIMPKRVRPNNSRTREKSEKWENKMAERFAINSYKEPHGKADYDIPFIEDKKFIIDNATTSTNVIDSIAKYTAIHNRNVQKAENPSKYAEPRKLDFSESIGLLHESFWGAQPYFNRSDIAKKSEEMENEYANSNYFTAFGSIPAEALVRNWHYKSTNVSTSTPPLLDAIRYYAEGDYNRGENNSNKEKHDRKVRTSGTNYMQNKTVQEWVKQNRNKPEYRDAFIKAEGGPLDNEDYVYDIGNPNGYDFSVIAEAPTALYSYGDWYTIGKNGQRVKATNFNPTGANIISDPQKFEQLRLAKAKEADLNKTHEFGELVRGFTTGLVTSALPSVNPLGATSSLAGSITGEELGYEIAGDKGRIIGGILGGFADPENITNATKQIKGARKYSRLQKSYTGVPHTPLKDRVTGNQVVDEKGNIIHLDENFLKANKNKEITIWTSDDIDYAKNGTFSNNTDNPVFDVYTDPKTLKTLDTPNLGDKMVNWQLLPFKFEDGKVSLADNLKVKDSGIPYSKAASLRRKPNGRYDNKDLGKYVFKDGEEYIINPKEYDAKVTTDDVVSYSKSTGHDATRFYNIMDGSTTINGDYYDYPINELVLNPGAESYILPHNTPKYKFIKEIVPFYNYIKPINLSLLGTRYNNRKEK